MVNIRTGSLSSFYEEKKRRMYGRGARFEEGLEGQARGHGEKDGGFTLQSGLQNASEPKRGLC